MADYMQIITSDVQSYVSQISQQAKAGDDMLGQIKSLMGPITGGAWKGKGADAFTQDILTKYIPEVMQLIAAIAGMSSGLGSGLDIFEQADNSASSAAGGLLESLNIF